MRSRTRRLAVVIVACFAAGVGVLAEFMMPDVENVPIERLIGNLERLIDAEPKDAELRANLARVHAMAYARQSTSAQVWRGKEREGAWTGHGPTHLQFEVKSAAGQAAAVARGHLTKAIARYEEAIKLAPDDLVARLGLGWCLVQAGERTRAIATLRDVFARAFPDDIQSKRFVLHGQRSLSEEAARYLIPLLDPERDKEELSTLRQRVKRLEALPRAITPIAIPLRDGLTAHTITDNQAGVRFDADGSGLKRQWTWITPDAGWLVYDQVGTKQVDSALKLFGSVTFWLFWENGYHAMRALDDNGDGRLAGKELRGLAVWHDRDRNGRSETGEVKPLAHWNIVALSHRYQIDATHPDEIAYAPNGVTFSDGTSRPTFDLILHSR